MAKDKDYAKALFYMIVFGLVATFFWLVVAQTNGLISKNLGPIGLIWIGVVPFIGGLMSTGATIIAPIAVLRRDK